MGRNVRSHGLQRPNRGARVIGSLGIGMAWEGNGPEAWEDQRLRHAANMLSADLLSALCSDKSCARSLHNPLSVCTVTSPSCTALKCPARMPGSLSLALHPSYTLNYV
jgi:hypothetical protein